MAPQPVCPYCQARVFPDDAANGECASCHGRLSAVSQSRSAELAPTAGGDRSERSLGAAPLVRSIVHADRPPPEAFVVVCAGVSLVWWGTALGAVFLLTVVIGAGAVWTMRPRVLEWFGRGLGTAWPFLLMTSGGVGLIGVALCCFVPRGCGAVKWVRLLLASLVLVLLLAPALFADVLWPGRPKAGCLQAVPALALFLGLGAAFFGWLCYFLLLAELARFFGDHRLAKAFVGYFVACLCGLFGSAVGGCVLFAAVADQLPGQVRPFVSVALFGLWLALTVALMARFLSLLTRLHRLIPMRGDPVRR